MLALLPLLFLAGESDTSFVFESDIPPRHPRRPASQADARHPLLVQLAVRARQLGLQRLRVRRHADLSQRLHGELTRQAVPSSHHQPSTFSQFSTCVNCVAGADGISASAKSQLQQVLDSMTSACAQLNSMGGARCVAT